MKNANEISSFRKIHSVTIVANQTTQANVRYNKYYRQAAITVKVVAAEETVGFGAKQTGAKEVTITGLEGIAKDDMEVTLKKGSNIISTTSVKAPDTNTLVLTTAVRLQDATYTVTVKDKTANFTGAMEKLTTLEITGDYAVVDNIDITKAKTATVPYKAENQYGEAMNVSLTASSSLSGTVAANKGIITITIPQSTDGTPSISLIAGQQISVSIVSAMDGKSAAKTVELSNASKIQTFTVENEIYNEHGLSFNEDYADVTKGETFYLLLDAKDQYGYSVTDAKKAEKNLMGVCTNSMTADMSKTASGDLVYKTITTKSGEKRLGVQIVPKQAGTTNVILTSMYYGESVQKEVTVVSGTKVDTIIFMQPDSVYPNKDILIPVEAFDAEGRAISDPKALNAQLGDENGKLSISGGKYTKNPFETVNGVLVYNAGSYNTNDTITITARTATLKFANITVMVKAAPTPDRIEKINDKKVLNLVSGGGVELKLSDFVIKDQDDQVMTAKELDGAGYVILVTTNTDFNNAGLNITGAGIDGVKTIINNASAGSITAGAINFNTIGEAKVSFEIAKKNGNKYDPVTTVDPLEVTIRNVSINKLSRAEIEAPEKIFAATSQASITHTIKEGLKVIGYYGTPEAKVIIPGEYWDFKNLQAVSDAFISVATQSGINGASIGAIDTATFGAITTAAVWWNNVPGTNGSKTTSVNISIAVSGSSVAATKTITACQAAPTLTTVAGNPYNQLGATVTKSGEDQFTVKIPRAKANDLTSGISGAAIISCLSVKDQYGVDFAVPFAKGNGTYEKDFDKIIKNPVILITGMSDKVTVTGNGSHLVKITGQSGAVASGESFTATITWGTKTITVTVEQR